MKGGLGRAGRRRRLLVTAAIVIVIGFVAMESYPRLREPWPLRMDVHDERGELTTRDAKHPVLQYVPPPGRQFTMKTYFEDRFVFEFPYSIDSNGLRMSSPDPTVLPEQCILFFGGSTPFGEGVLDSETVPYLVAEAKHPRYGVYNFGYYYYGGHQMAASLETGMVSEVIDCQPRYAIYFGFVAHAARAAFEGVPSSQRRPLYIRDDDGSAYLVNWPYAFDSLYRIVGESRVVQKIEKMVANFLDNGHHWQDDADLYIAIVEKARRSLEQDYPGIQFHMIFWDERGFEQSEYIVAELLKHGFAIHFITEIFPHYDYGRMGYSLGPEYMISDVTWHLNARAYRMIAEYIASYIVE